MGGLARLCKLYGGMSFTDKDGKTVEYVWDYAKDEPRLKGEMTQDELIASERAKWEGMKERFEVKKEETKN